MFHQEVVEGIARQADVRETESPKPSLLDRMAEGRWALYVCYAFPFIYIAHFFV